MADSSSKNEEKTSSSTAVLRKHPIFSSLSTDDLDQLAALLTAKTFQPGEIIVDENTLIDSIYFIVDGQAEVSKQQADSSGKMQSQPICTLSNGESIGLSQTGLFSQSGARTATITAVNTVTAIQLNLKDFHQYISTHQQANKSLLEHTNLLLRLNFLKQIAPFAEFSIDELKNLANQIEEKMVPANVDIFKQGEMGDYCYIIDRGAVEVHIEDAQGSRKILAELKPGDLLGESALLMDLPRNATATTKEETRLLLINKELFHHVVKSDVRAADALYALQHRRTRPVQLAHIQVYVQKNPDGEEITILKDPDKFKYFQLPEYGLFIWKHLDGKHSLNEITIEFFKEFNIFNPSIVSACIISLYEAGFIHLDIKKQTDDIKLPLLLRGFMKIQRLMEISIIFGNVDEWLTKSYSRFVWIFFSKVSRIVLPLIVLSGFLVFVLYFHHTANLLNVSPYKWTIFFAALILGMSTIVLHELAHAYSTKSFGHSVKCFGIGWFWLSPMAFCDTSDMWLAPKNQRIAVDVSGLYLNLIFAGVSGLMMLFTNTPELLIFFWLFSLINYLAVMTNMDPLIELDGYYLLIDVLNAPNLRESAFSWLADELFSKDKSTDSLIQRIKAHPKEMIYWTAVLSHIIFIQIIFPYILLKYLIHGLFNVRNPLFTIAIVILIISVSCFSIFGQLKQKRKSLV